LQKSIAEDKDETNTFYTHSVVRVGHFALGARSLSGNYAAIKKGSRR